MSPSCVLEQPNARGEPPPEAEARYERTLEAVGSTAKLGVAARNTDPREGTCDSTSFAFSACQKRRCLDATTG
jgi:hypothetical protein